MNQDSAAPDKGRPAQAPETDSAPDIADGRVLKVHRIGAVLVAVVIATFGLLGLAGGLDFFTTRGESVAGLSSDGLLSVISLITPGSSSSPPQSVVGARPQP